jgi:peptide deformylase
LAGDPVLRQVAREVTADDYRSGRVDSLVQSMRVALDGKGVGLAAPQIGVPLRVLVVEDRPAFIKRLPPERVEDRGRRPIPFQVVVNPQLEVTDDRQLVYLEACLSVPGFRGLVPRARAVTVRGLDDHGYPLVIEASDWHARILQHEIDHLNGFLYVTRMIAGSFTSEENADLHWDARVSSKGLPEELCR